MKGIMQTRFGRGHGNCFQACLASVFELSLEEVPDFAEGPDFCTDEMWNQRWDKWNDQNNLNVVLVDILVDGTMEAITSDAIVIATGQSPRNQGKHSVVWKNGVVIHDPYPVGHGASGASGLIGPPTCFTIIVPKDPSILPGATGGRGEL